MTLGIMLWHFGIRDLGLLTSFLWGILSGYVLWGWGYSTFVWIFIFNSFLCAFALENPYNYILESTLSYMDIMKISVCCGWRINTFHHTFRNLIRQKVFRREYTMRFEELFSIKGVWEQPRFWHGLSLPGSIRCSFMIFKLFYGNTSGWCISLCSKCS